MCIWEGWESSEEDIGKMNKAVGKNDRGNFEIFHEKKMAVVAPEYKGNKITFVLTAFKRRKE